MIALKNELRNEGASYKMNCRRGHHVLSHAKPNYGVEDVQDGKPIIEGRCVISNERDWET